MPLSPKILRGVDIKGWKTYLPRVPGEDESGDNLKREKKGLPAEELSPLPTREELERERAVILEAARQEGEQVRRQLLAKAEEEAKALREQAREQGYREGLARGEAEAGRLREEAAHVLEKARAEHRSLLDGAEEQILRIALSVAEKLLHVQMELNEEVILALLARCLESHPAGQELLLRVNPAHEELCRRKLQDLQGYLRREASLQLVADAALPYGSCVVESEEAETAVLLQKELEILSRRLLALAKDKRGPEAEAG